MTSPLEPATASSAEIPPGHGRLEDRVVLVFGAGSVGEGWGNGKAAAVAYAREGAVVVAVDRERAAAEATAAIVEKLGGRCSAHAADVTDSNGVEAVVAEVLAAHGRIDVLHNNVGTTIMGGPVELTEAQWDTVMDVNLKGAFLTCKHVLPAMLDRGRGAIINISSVAAIRYTGYPYAAYYAAKAGVNQFTVGLAIQYARHGIRVNAIMPGLMNTPLITGRSAASTPTPRPWCGRGTRLARWAAWARAGISPRRPCSWLRTRPPTSPASACPSTAASPAGAADTTGSGRRWRSEHQWIVAEAVSPASRSAMSCAPASNSVTAGRP